MQTEDFETLAVIQAVNRLYSNDEKLDIDASLSLSRRFAYAFKLVGKQERLQSVIQEVRYYNRMLSFYGVRDHQVKNTALPVYKAVLLLIYRSIQILVLLVLACPMLVLGSPLLYFAGSISHKKMIEAKAGSSVKIAGKDVVSTWKLLTSLVMIPTLWIFYALLTYTVSLFLSNYRVAWTNMVIFLVVYPILGYSTIIISDIGLDIAKSLPPIIVSLGNTISSSEPLRELRRKLKNNIEQIVRELGPSVFPDFEDSRMSAKFDAVSARKMGRTQTFQDIGTDDVESINEGEYDAWDELANQM